MFERRARLVLVALSVCWEAMAFGLYQARATEPLWPSIWPWWFGLAALATLALAVTLSRPALFVSAVIVVTGFAGRVLASVYRHDHRALVAGAVYLAMTVLVEVVWVHLLGPVVSWHHQKRGG